MKMNQPSECASVCVALRKENDKIIKRPEQCSTADQKREDKKKAQNMQNSERGF